MVARVFLLLVFVFLTGCGSKPAPSTDGGSGRTAAPPVVAGPTEKGKPTATFPPDDWTHADLVKYLGQKGVKVEVSSGGILSRPDRVAAWLDSQPRGERADEYSRVLVYRCADREAARVSAGAEAAGSFTCGRFAVCNNSFTKPEDIMFFNSIRTALESR